VLKRILMHQYGQGPYGQGHNPFMVHHAQVWSRASTLQMVPGGNAAVKC